MCNISRVSASACPRFGVSPPHKKGPLAHPPEPGYPCCVSALGELAWMAPREEPGRVYPLRGRVVISSGYPVRFIEVVRGRPPRRIRLVAYGARLESVLGESPRGFESPILRTSTSRWVKAQRPQPGFESPILRPSTSGRVKAQRPQPGFESPILRPEVPRTREVHRSISPPHLGPVFRRISPQSYFGRGKMRKSCPQLGGPWSIHFYECPPNAGNPRKYSGNGRARDGSFDK